MRKSITQDMEYRQFMMKYAEIYGVSCASRKYNKIRSKSQCGLGRPRRHKGKAFVEISIGIFSTWILATLRNRQFLSLMEANQAIREKLEVFNRKPF